jgi:hypothetical protein
MLIVPSPDPVSCASGTDWTPGAPAVPTDKSPLSPMLSGDARGRKTKCEGWQFDGQWWQDYVKLRASFLLL